MSDYLQPVLIDAKKEYLVRLSELMLPFLMKFVNNAYAEAHEEAGGKALLTFQCMMRAVPQWNASLIRERTAAIENKYSFFADLVAAVFVAFIKVLSSIKISSQRPNIKLKLPNNDALVHKVYVCVAKNFYENPTAVRDGDQATKSRLIYAGIETAVRDMLPLGEVLTAYLSTAVDDDNAVNAVLSPMQSDDEDAVSSGDDSSDDDDDNNDGDATKTVPLEDFPSQTPDFPTPAPQQQPQFAPSDAMAGQVPQHASQAPEPSYQTPPIQPEYAATAHTQQPPQSFQPFTPPHSNAGAPGHMHAGPPKQPLFDDATDDDRHFG
jgi:hypothetical protein